MIDPSKMKKLPHDIQSEDVLLAQCFQWAWNELPATRRLLFHVPNELDRLPGETQQNHIRRLSQAKAKGVVPGEPDIVFRWKGVAYGLECKTLTGVVSHNQVKVHEAWNADGPPVVVFRSLQEFKRVIHAIIGGTGTSFTNQPTGAKERV